MSVHFQPADAARHRGVGRNEDPAIPFYASADRCAYKVADRSVLGIHCFLQPQGNQQSWWQLELGGRTGFRGVQPVVLLAEVDLGFTAVLAAMRELETIAVNHALVVSENDD